MTGPEYTPVANVPPGGFDESNAYGPTVTGSGVRPAVIPGYPSDVATGDQSYSPTADASEITVPRANFQGADGAPIVHGEMTADSSNGPQVRDPDGDGLPDIARYEAHSPDGFVTDDFNALPSPMVNPSAGNQADVEQGMNDVNPEGWAPSMLDHVATPVRVAQVVPDTTQDNYPRGDGAHVGPTG